MRSNSRGQISRLASTVKSKLLLLYSMYICVCMLNTRVYVMHARTRALANL